MWKKRHSILIVDDERSNISVLKNILSPDYTVYAANDGQSAIETALEFLPDVILLDIIMPEMDGYEVIAELRKFENTRNIPIIFITGLDNAEAEEKCLGLGAADYIIKPFYSSIVKLRIKNQINLLEQLRQQALITKISHNFLSDEYVDSLFTDTLRMVGEFMNVSQVLLYKLENDVFVCNNEWLQPELNLKTQIGDKLKDEKKIIQAAIDSISENKNHFCISSNDQFFNDSAKPFRKNFHNYITVPIFIKGNIYAFVDFSRNDDEKKWTESEINLALLLSNVFAGVFERDTMERQFSIVENTPNLILSITTEAAVKYVNPAVTNITGYTKNELITEGLDIIFDKEKMIKIREKYIPSAMFNEIVKFETDMIHKDGGKRILAVSVFQTGKNSFGVIIDDLTKMRELEIENEKVFLDGLTNIYNRRFFDESITRIVKSLSRSDGVLSLMVIDIDFFKRYNDTYGHAAGDACLKTVAELLKKGLPRGDDFVARYGGEEFVVALPNTDETGAKMVANRLLEVIRNNQIPHKTNDAADYVTLSIGITTGNVRHEHNAEDFIKRADEMLYRAKQGGRNQCVFGSIPN
jgi:diguanylate cyclase (GGDEF)-like protein/PAS domain S-box-containing protein